MVQKRDVKSQDEYCRLESEQASDIDRIKSTITVEIVFIELSTYYVSK